MNRAKADIWQVLQESWPPERTSRYGAFLWQDGGTGGNRVNAARALGPISFKDVETLETHFASQGRTPLFQITQNDSKLDSILAKKGYDIRDKTVCFSAPVEQLSSTHGETNSVQWPPSDTHREHWARAGIGPDRLAIMERVRLPKTVISLEGGLAFVAVHGPNAALHAMDVAPKMRRQGKATQLIAQAASWASSHGATTLALLATTANSPAMSLYSSLGMQRAQGYHYRMKEDQ